MTLLGPGPPHLPQVFLLLGGGDIKNFKNFLKKKSVQILNNMKNISKKYLYLTHSKKYVMRQE